MAEWRSGGGGGQKKGGMMDDWPPAFMDFGRVFRVWTFLVADTEFGLGSAGPCREKQRTCVRGFEGPFWESPYV